MMTPIASVSANPLTEPLPNTNNTAAAISVVTFPSRIAENALRKPLSIASGTFAPRAISSFVLV